MMQTLTVVAWSLLLLTLAGCTARQPILLRVPPDAVALAGVLAATPLRKDDNIRVTPLERGENLTLQLVQIRDREPPHIHTRYDLVVVLVGGFGTLYLDDEPLAMKSGDIAFIPRNTAHFFVNEGESPAAALVVFAPQFDGPDQAPVPEPTRKPAPRH